MADQLYFYTHTHHIHVRKYKQAYLPICLSLSLRLRDLALALFTFLLFSCFGLALRYYFLFFFILCPHALASLHSLSIYLYLWYITIASVVRSALAVALKGALLRYYTIHYRTRCSKSKAQQRTSNEEPRGAANTHTHIFIYV